MFQVKGYDQTRGYAQDIGRKCKEDSTIVEQIKELGGVPFVLTNVPRTLLSYSCTNPIYGTTSNAFREDRTSGGSSGGEGALIACGGSLIGIGTDVGGSIRYPCHFNGIAGIKPSHTRLSKLGVLNSVPGRQLADAAVGPMSKRIFACVYFLRHMWSKKYQYVKDPYSSPVDWDETQYSSRCKLRIGYYIDDGWFTPTPALQRAVLEAKVALEKCGHSLIEFRPSDVIQAFQNFSAAITVDGGEYLRRKLSKDLGGCDERSLTVWILRLPVWAKRIVAFLIEPIYPRIAIQLRAIPSTISELRSVYEQIENYRHKFVQKMHDEHIDAILCPIQVIPAPTHDVPAKLSAAGSYCSLFNILDFAAGTVNVTRVSEQDERHLNEEYPTSDPWYILAKKAAMDSVGLPVGVQVAAPPFKEETVLRVLKDIEETIASSDGHGRD
ncbi:hypothetical protein AB6A40_007429 [Gnathostoma spinigerum]|uniref:fatty acid amide hydrolase n=1 Tax=Gnathostoma spinigerum TaxID=75299 RepID=A0ABD6EL71_9BILA